MNFKFFLSPQKLIVYCSIILLATILYFDFWVYKNFVLQIDQRVQKNEIEKNFLLKTPLLKKAAEEIRKKDEFLQNPKYPLIKDLF